MSDIWYGRADYDFLETQKGELQLQIGDVVLVENVVNESWLTGRNIISGHCGMFPVDFVTKITVPHNMEPGQRVLVASGNFQAQQTGDLGFDKGTIILAIRQIDSNWSDGYLVDPSTGKTTGRKGAFPVNFTVQINHKEEEEVVETNECYTENNDHDVSVEMETKESGPFAKVIHDLTPQLDGEINLKKGQLVTVLEAIDEFYLRVKTQGQNGVTGLCPKTFLNIESQDLPAPALRSSSDASELLDAPVVPYGCAKYPFKAQCLGELSVDHGDILNLKRHVDDEWIECEIDGKVGLVPTSYIDIVMDCPKMVMPSTTASDSGYLSEEPSDFWKTSDERTVLFDFESSESGDLSAKKGDTINVFKTVSADWLEGVNLANGRRGIIPANYVSSKLRPKSMDEVKLRNVVITSESIEESIKRNLNGLDPDLNSERSRASTSDTASYVSATELLDPVPFVKQPKQISPIISKAAETPKKSVPPPRPVTSPRFGLEFLHKRQAQKEEERKEKHKTERLKVAQELLKSEKAFLNDLEISIRVLREFKSARLDSETLILGFRDAAELSRKVVACVDGEFARDFSLQTFGSIFIKLTCDFKKVYSRFWEHGEEALSMLDKYMQDDTTKEALNQSLRRMQHQGNSCIDMHSLICRPVQRILKYPLFLGQMLKRTEEDHIDKSKLLEAVHLMTELAQSINEYKRRKDLVVKYRKDGDQSISDRLSKISIHSMRKKGSRFSVRFSSTIGLTHLVRDETFDSAEKEFRNIQKCVDHFSRDVRTYCDRLQHSLIQQQSLADIWNEVWTGPSGQPPYDLAQSLCQYRKAWRTSTDSLLPSFFQCVRDRVRQPLHSLCTLFEGPEKLIAKRKDKLLDYEAATGRVKSGSDISKIAMQEQERTAKVEYEALNAQLIAELPKLISLSHDVLNTCVHAFLRAQKNFSGELKKVFDSLHGITVSPGTNRSSIWANFESKHKRALQQLAALTTFQGLKSAPVSFGTSSARSSQRSKSYVQQSHKTSIAFPQRKQAEADKDSLRQKYHSNQLYVVIDDSRLAPKQDQIELAVNKGDIVVALIKKDPMGESSRWYVDNGVAKGFVPREILAPLTSTNQRPPLPMSNQRPTLPPKSESISLIDFSNPSSPSEGPNHMIDLIDIDLSSASNHQSSPKLSQSVQQQFKPVLPKPIQWTQQKQVPKSDRTRSIAKPPLKRSTTERSTVPVRQAPPVPVRPEYQNVGFDEDDVKQSDEKMKQIMPIRAAPPPPPAHNQTVLPRYDIVEEGDHMNGVENTDTEFYAAQYDYRASDTHNQLNLTEGQLVAVHSKADQDGNPEWWLVEDEYGTIGYVPANYLQPHGS